MPNNVSVEQLGDFAFSVCDVHLDLADWQPTYIALKMGVDVSYCYTVADLRRELQHLADRTCREKYGCVLDVAEMADILDNIIEEYASDLKQVSWGAWGAPANHSPVSRGVRKRALPKQPKRYMPPMAVMPSALRR